MDDTPLLMIEDAEGLSALMKHLADEPVIGIDTESDSMHSYREKVCLIQISDRRQDYIVDPLADFDLGPLGELMSDANRVKIFHGADYDVVSLKRDFGWTITNLFDTMIAAQLLDLPKVGLADLCRNAFGAHMDKKYQTHNWALRPLQPEHLYYARGDTHYLLALRELLLMKLKRVKRLDVAEEEFQALESRTWRGGADNSAAFLRVKGSNKLDDAGLKVLRALWQLRDGRASELNRPAYKVFPDPVLLKIAANRPSTMDELSHLIRAKSSMYRRHGQTMLDAVVAGLASEEPIPAPPKKVRVGTKPRYGARETDRLHTVLKGWRAKRMKDGKLPLVMIGSNSQLKAIAGYRPHDGDELGEIEELRSWQIERYGEEILEMVTRFEAELAKGGGSGGGGRRRRRRG